MSSVSVRFVPSMHDIPKSAWDALVDANGATLLSHALLSLFEDSASMRPESGWTPAHALLERDGRLVGGAPLYIKTHSMGEFVFDFEFADLAERSGLAWYPKLVGVVPATPASGWRLLIDPKEDEAEASALFLDAVDGFVRSESLAGSHLLWVDPAWAARIDRRWTPWIHQGFSWLNDGSKDFESWLGTFSKNMRRNVQRERSALAEAGVSVSWVRGRDAEAELYPLMSRLYLRTNERFGPWGARFLEPAFFELLKAAWPEGHSFSVARDRSGRPFALALLYQGRDTLYGRYWGTERDLNGLHFETCYYTPIAHALEQGITRFDPGMGGEHKARRGFRSIAAYSFHRPADPRLRQLMAQVLPQANRETLEALAQIDEDLPFKRKPDGSLL